MTILKKLVTVILATSTFTAVGLTAMNNGVFVSTKADGVPYLSNANSPTLTNGSGTMVDSKGITWEYSNALDYNNGHISINHGGYFGISSSSAWGLTGITDLKANFVANEGDELWLLTSYNGIEWNEQLALKNGISTSLANSWKYVRFYNYSENNHQIDVDSVYIEAVCAYTDASEDIDAAHVDDVELVSENITISKETEDVSPRLNSTEAVRFTKTDNNASWVILYLKREFNTKDIAYHKVEFDLKGNVNYGRTVELMYGNTRVGAQIWSTKGTSYKMTPLDNGWYHMEIPVTAFFSLISGYGDSDKPGNVGTKKIDGVKLNCGSAIIDNMRICSTQCELGIYNNPDYKPTVGSVYWVKVSWVGVLHSCEITIDDPTMGERIPLDDPNLLNGSPLYIRWSNTPGTATLSITMVVGYDRQTVSLSNVSVTIYEA